MGSVVLNGATSGSTTLTPTDAVTVNLTLPSTSGTLQTSGSGYTTNGVAYASSTSALATSGNLTYTGTKLTINGSTGTTALQVGLTNATNNPYLAISQSESGSYSKIDANGTTIPACNLVFATAGSEAMRLTSSGYLGIGTSSPTASLTVNGNISIPEKTSAVIGVDYATTSGNGGNLTVRAGDGSGSGNTSGNLYLAFGRGGASASNGYMAFGVAQSDNSSGLNSEYMRLDNSGNLGLGVTPSAWGGSYKSIDWAGGAVSAYSNSQFSVWQNSYDSGAGAYKYVNTAAASRYQQISGQHIWYNAPSGTAGNAITFTQAMTLDNSGRLLVGSTTNNGSSLIQSWQSGSITNGGLQYVARDTNSNNSRMTFGVTNSVSAFITGGSSSNPPFVWYTNDGSTEQMRIDSSGNVLVGSTSTANNSKLYVNQTGTSASQSAQFDSASSTYSTLVANNTNSSYTDTVIRAQATKAGATTFYLFDGVANSARTFGVFGNGNVVNTNNSYGAISDVKLKENIVDATPKLVDLLKVQVRNYNLKIDPTHKQLGVIAQELETVFPAMVEETQDTDKDGNDLGTTTKSVKYSVFVPMLIKAIQELNTLVTTQAETITSMQATITALQTKVGV